METPSRKGRLRAPAGGGRIVASGLGTVASSQEAALVGQAKSRRPTDPPPAKRPWIGGGWNGDPTTFTVGGRFCPASRIASPVCALHPLERHLERALGLVEGSGGDPRDAGGIGRREGRRWGCKPRGGHVRDASRPPPRFTSFRKVVGSPSPVQPQAEPGKTGKSSCRNGGGGRERRPPLAGGGSPQEGHWPGLRPLCWSPSAGASAGQASAFGSSEGLQPPWRGRPKALLRKPR